jgi:hypothetical protein
MAWRPRLALRIAAIPRAKQENRGHVPFREKVRVPIAPFERLDRAEQLYWRRCTAPADKAAIALALTPAPDIAALRAKLAVLRAHALDEEDALPHPALKLVDEDLRRMTGKNSTRP